MTRTHQWVAVVVYELDTDVIRKCLSEQGSMDLHRDQVKGPPEIFCWVCEQPVTVGLGSKCKGEPNDG